MYSSVLYDVNQIIMLIYDHKKSGNFLFSIVRL